MPARVHVLARTYVSTYVRTYVRVYVCGCLPDGAESLPASQSSATMALEAGLALGSSRILNSFHCSSLRHDQTWADSRERNTGTRFSSSSSLILISISSSLYMSLSLSFSSQRKKKSDQSINKSRLRCGNIFADIFRLQQSTSKETSPCPSSPHWRR